MCFFDNLRTEQTKNQAKTIDSYEVLSDTTSILNINDSIQFTAHYTDGSYYMGDSVTTLNIESEPYSVSWSDRFGNDLEFPLQTSSFKGAYFNEITHTYHISMIILAKRLWTLKQQLFTAAWNPSVMDYSRVALCLKT